MSRDVKTPEDLDAKIAAYDSIMLGCQEGHPVYVEAKEIRDRLIRTQELMREGMEYWPAYVKARMEQGYDH